ncbi:MAG: hypothetical protein GF419_13425 [Ignavibacteriales bacterium]|nr:hypothetical protein [Ignavibacteriales bacterium]
MKRLSIIVWTIAALLSAGAVGYAQSDKQIVDDFKGGYQAIWNDVEGAQSLGDLESLKARANALKSKYAPHRELLDDALYPDGWNASFSKLNRRIDDKRADVGTITTLETEVAELSSTIDSLKMENQQLRSQIAELNAQADKDQATIDSLNTLVRRLRANIARRDELLTNIIDSTFAEFGPDVSDREMGTMVAEAEEKNLFEKIKGQVQGNINALEMGLFSADGLSEMKESRDDMKSRWDRVGPQLAEFYVNKKDRQETLRQIDGLFVEWDEQIRIEMWNGVNAVFENYGVKLQPFESGDEFVGSATTFINDQIKNAETMDSDKALQTYHSFADSAWFGAVTNEWLPVLIEHKMFSQEQKDTIDMKIAEWKETVEPTGMTLWIVIIVVVVVALVIVFLAMGGKKKDGDNAVREEPREEPADESHNADKSDEERRDA